MSQSKAKLIYVGDPMCSWCYGVAPELSKLMNHYEGQLDFELVLGGLRPYNRQSMTDLKEFLTGHWEEVNQRSGQEFNYGILDEPSITYDTEPPSRATIVVRRLSPENELAFFKKAQVSFYKENKNMHLPESYKGILDELNISYEDFTKLFESSEMKELIKADFERSAELGIRGFPSFLLEYNGQIQLIANGYSTSEKMIARIENSLK